MEFKAEQKFILISPRKLRPVADVIRKVSPVTALQVLPNTGKRGAEPLGKVIKAALANAKQKGVGEGDLAFKEIMISEGPRLKRGQPVSRGMWHPIKKRMSHIRVVLTTQNEKMPNAKLQMNEKTSNNDKPNTKTRKVTKSVAQS